MKGKGKRTEGTGIMTLSFNCAVKGQQLNKIKALEIHVKDLSHKKFGANNLSPNEHSYIIGNLYRKLKNW